jgi:transposase
MVVPGLDVNGILHKRSQLEAQLQATLDLLPAYAWSARPNGALTFVNLRTADYLGLPTDHPLRFGIDTGADWAPTSLFCIRMMALREGIASFDREIEKAVAPHPDFAIFHSFPGAGPALAPRLLAAFGAQRDRYQAAADLQTFSGVAPVTQRSGKSEWVHVRWACPHFIRQTFHEWAAHSIGFCDWAAAYYGLQRDRGKDHHAAIRTLAFKWIRIAFRCWKDGRPYDDARYVQSLRRRASPLIALLDKPSLS